MSTKTGSDQVGQRRFRIRVLARAGDAQRNITPRKVTAGITAVALAVGSIGVYESSKDVAPADAAANRSQTMRPVQFMNSIRKRERFIYMDSDMAAPAYMNYVRATLSESKLVMRGRCNPSNPWSPGIRAYIDTDIELTTKSCARQIRDYAYKHPDHMGENGKVSYLGLLERLGSKGAASANVPTEKVGTTKKIVANRSRATITYANDTEGNGRSLKKLVLAQRHVPGGRVLVRLGWFRAK